MPLLVLLLAVIGGGGYVVLERFGPDLHLSSSADPPAGGYEVRTSTMRFVMPEEPEVDPVPADELEKARGYAKGRFVLRLESPQGTIMYGLRREVLEGRAVEPADVLAELDRVTAEDIQRVARDVVGGDRLNLAVIGPFDDSERFEQLLG